MEHIIVDVFEEVLIILLLPKTKESKDNSERKKDGSKSEADPGNGEFRTGDDKLEVLCRLTGEKEEDNG